MKSMIRLIVGIPVAVIVTVYLFLFMAFMINKPADIDESKIKTVKIELGRKILDTDLSADLSQFDPPSVDTPPPPPPAMVDASFKPDLDAVVAAKPNFEAKVDIGNGFNPDRDAQPLVRIPPQYPDRCQSRSGARETVVVEFDVNVQGQTLNPRIVNSTNSCLNRSATRAVERWKYRPKIVDGEAQPRFGVRTTFRFDLAAE